MTDGGGMLYDKRDLNRSGESIWKNINESLYRYVQSVWFQNTIAVMENGIDVIWEDNLSKEDISFWKELYYSWEKWEEEQANDSSVLAEINQSILDRWPDEEQAQENLKSISGYKRVPTLLDFGYWE